MATQMQLRGGTTAETLTFTGAQREVTVDTDKNTLVVQDGVTPGGFPLATEDAVSDGTFYYSDDTGDGSAADAYILVPKANTNVPSAYLDGVMFGFTTNNANTGPSTANFQGLGVKNIKYPGGVDPAAGDISGRVNLVYDAANDWLELQRKAKGNEPQVREIGASVSSNAMTVTLAPCNITFRSPTISDGAVLNGVVTSQISLVVPAGATLGTVSGQQSQIVIVAIYNAGVVELAVVNLSGNNQLSEDSLINTTAISAASSSASTFYSANARTGVPYRVVGYVQSTQAAAGTWATSPNKVQGQGGQNIIKPLPLVSGTAQATTSGTAIDFTGIPSTVKRITVMFDGVSTTGTSIILIQLGSGTVEATGYTGAASTIIGASTGSSSIAVGFAADIITAAAGLLHGTLTLTRVSGNQWTGVGIFGRADIARNSFVVGSKSLSGALDRIRVTAANGTDSFDAGTINIMYES